MTRMTLTVAKLVKALFSMNQKVNPLKNCRGAWREDLSDF